MLPTSGARSACPMPLEMNPNYEENIRARATLEHSVTQSESSITHSRKEPICALALEGRRLTEWE